MHFLYCYYYFPAPSRLPRGLTDILKSNRRRMSRRRQSFLFTVDHTLFRLHHNILLYYDAAVFIGRLLNNDWFVSKNDRFSKRFDIILYKYNIYNGLKLFIQREEFFFFISNNNKKKQLLYYTYYLQKKITSTSFPFFYIIIIYDFFTL